MEQKDNLPKITFDFTEFDVLLKSQTKQLPKEVFAKYNMISEFLIKALLPSQSLHIVYPKNKEVYIGNSSNVDFDRLDELGKIIYDFVVYDKLLPDSK